MPVNIPPGVTVEIKGNSVTARGPKGELSRDVSADMQINIEGSVLTVSRPSDNREHRSLHGLTRTLIANMVSGVSSGFEKDLDIVGVGYRAEQSGEKLTVRIGYSHPVEIKPLPGVALSAPAPNKIKVSGINKETVGEMAAIIRALRPPDSYKGKGIRYTGERVRLKPGKAGKVMGKK
jgi:large subunit ribosomal protein L6